VIEAVADTFQATAIGGYGSRRSPGRRHKFISTIPPRMRTWSYPNPAMTWPRGEGASRRASSRPMSI